MWVIKASGMLLTVLLMVLYMLLLRKLDGTYRELTKLGTVTRLKWAIESICRKMKSMEWY